MKKIFNIILYFIIIVIVFSVIINAYFNFPKNIYNKIESQALKTDIPDYNDYNEWLWADGRAFSYTVIFMNVFSPATLNLSIRKKDTRFIIEAILNQREFFKKFYDFRLSIESQVDIASKCPYIYRESMASSEKNGSKEIIFNQNEHFAERKGIKTKIPENTCDPLSIIFKFLSLDFKVNEPITLYLLSKEDIYEFAAVTKELKNGIYRIEGEVFRKNRSSTHGAKFTAWVLDGKVRLPLMFKVVTAAGPLYLRLNSIK